jgi:hypothetical protein
MAIFAAFQALTSGKKAEVGEMLEKSALKSRDTSVVQS